jgi:putative phosphoesterase
MKVAILADVHANLPALKAVLADIDSRGVDAVWNVGDFVGYGAHPDEVVALLARRADVSIMGNYDRKVLSFPEKKDKWLSSKNPEKVHAFGYAWEHLSQASRRYLASLPAEARLTSGGLSVLLVHGSPDAEDEPLTDDTEESRLAELAPACDADVVVCGHSHRAMCREVAGVLFVGTGSVGRPEGGDRRACYATMEIGGGRIEVEHHRVAYDVDEAVRAIRSGGQPEAFARMVRTGQGYQQAKQAEARQEKVIAAATALAERCGYDRPHTEHATRLALGLLAKLAGLHGLGEPERLMLHCAGLLHDIGWCEGGDAHHKTAMRLILADRTIPLDERERAVVACVARYHRKAAPLARHECFAELGKEDRRTVRLLAGMLRLADGLDCTHRALVRDLDVEVRPGRVDIVCHAEGDAADELATARDKAGVLEQALGREVRLRAE